MKFHRTIQLMGALAVACAVNARATPETWSITSGAQIPDNSPDSGLLSSIKVSAGDPQFTGIDSPFVAQLADIQLDISGGWNGDYVVTLFHILPDTSVQSVVLLNRIGQDLSHPDGFENGGLDNVTLEEGQPDIHIFGGSYTDLAALTGNYGPDGAADFSAFTGATPLGTWSLYLTDNSGGDVGVLENWSMDMNIVSAPEPGSAAIFSMGLLALCGRQFWRCKPGR